MELNDPFYLFFNGHNDFVNQGMLDLLLYFYFHFFFTNVEQRNNDDT